jgi:hypothetical protein
MYLDDNFVRTVSKRVDDCSSVSQLREYLNRYRSYMFSENIREVFLARIRFFEVYNAGDSEILRQCSDITDDIEVESMISNVCRNNLYSGIGDDIISFNDFNYNTDEERNALIKVFEYFNGNKLDICRYLDIENVNLNNKIVQYDLKEDLNIIRRDYRGRNFS